jgi:hypothetical protein
VHTDHRTLRVDSEQYEAGEGPCLHAARTRSIVLVDAVDAVDSWPRFAAAAAEEGIRSFLAAPLFTPEHTLGSLNLYGRNHSTCSPPRSLAPSATSPASSPNAMSPSPSNAPWNTVPPLSKPRAC